MTRGQMRLVARTPGSLPMFRIQHSKMHGFKITCTRCGNSLWMTLAQLKAWQSSMPQPTRACTFCFKVSRIRKGE